MDNRHHGASDDTTVTGLGRRQVLRVAGGALAGALVVPLLEACAAPTPPAVGNGAGAASTRTTAAGAFPTYLPVANGPKPDFPSTGPQYDDAFSRYPANPTKALPAEPPGAGSTVAILSIALFPPPTPFEQNPAWQAVNKALNADVRFQIATLGDYAAKLATVMAGNDLPDLIYLFSAAGGSSTLAAAAGVPQFLEAKAADLTPYLAGDAARDYPNLAAIPTSAWKNAGCAYRGKLYLVPIHRYLPGFVFLKNAQVYDQEIGKDYVPKSADDFKRILQALTRPQEDFYGLGASRDTLMHLPRISAWFGAPNGWRLEASGKLTKDWETAEYKEAAGYARDLFAAGVYHPDSVAFASNVVVRQKYVSRSFAIYGDPFNGWQDGWRQALQSPRPFDSLMIPPFPAHEGGRPQHFIGGGHLWATAVKKSSPERTKELLRILNWLAAPFGSAEDLLLTFGVSGVDYTLDDRGNPVLTERGNPDANYVPWKYVVQHPFVFFTPDIPDYARTMSEAEHQLLPVAVSDPTLGQVSNADFTRGFNLTKTMTDGLVDIVVGRRPFSDYDQLVRDWQNNGGEQIRGEYAESIAASA
jgi:putative aldouronate transport system substrate-binding protein